MKSIHRMVAGVTLFAVAVSSALLSGKEAKSDDTYLGKGAAGVYGPVAPDQIEFLSTPDQIMSATSSGAPAKIWEVLEHGEKIECMACIPAVSGLLYNANPEVREISAWWLRRRIFGVFGAGEIYEQTVNTLKSNADPQKRAYAASALGEFLARPGINACANAIRQDTDATVRAAAATALGRLNDEGGGALSAALADNTADVRLAALKSVTRINRFADVPAVTKLVGDPSSAVRKHAAETLEALSAKDSVASLASAAKGDSDAAVRSAACHALGALRDASVRPVLEAIAQTDVDTFVRDQAKIALLRL